MSVPLIVNAISSRKVVIFSGGSAANSLVDVYNELNCSLTYVIPISDNGGSSSELIRVFGGPGIGDVRSIILFLAAVRCFRLGILSIYLTKIIIVLSAS